MKLKLFPCLLLTAFLLTAGFLSSNAQGGARQSPKMTATGKIGEANITITYSSPAVKGRNIWGGLVPYGKVWRAGANEATIFETDKDVMVEGKKLAAGKYSLYALPGEKEWQFIFNSQTGQWGIERSGETTRKADKDVLVVNVKPQVTSSMEESLLYQVNGKGIVLKWEKLEVPVSIK
ncbi:DUF2911 domain-containing protein [Segetibacter aerophilus]|nr:DUF2911 domain-containing protein [Segetibacter aerophilus]